ncbi:MAG: hypothetical protein WC710_15085 [Gallionella sp.]|jgi:hypothetical protein
MSYTSQLWGMLPLTVFGCLIMTGRLSGLSWTDSLLRSVTLWAAIVWGLANGLSAWGVLTPGSIQIAWLMGAVIAVAYFFIKYRSQSLSIEWDRPRLGWNFETVASGAIMALVLLALFTAVVAPPVTVDVLNYHAPRQLMWLQQGSLAHYLTVNDRQLMMPPLAEVIGLQFYALTGGDYWMNLPQWFAYALLPVVVGATLRTLGCSLKIALLAAWLTVCLPMAYLEAANGKNDLQGALWIALLLREVAQARAAKERISWHAAVRVGLLVGLAVLNKSTALVFAPPLVVAGIVFWVRGHGRRAWRPVVVAAVVAMITVMPFFIRNMEWYGTPLGIHRAEDGGQQANTAFTPGIVVSNALRNAAQHLSGPAYTWNHVVDEGVRKVHEWMGLSINDPRSTCWVTVFEVVYAPTEETMAGAPWHFILIVITIMTAFIWRRAGDWRWLAWVCVAMALAYCVVIKWQPWGARLQQPVFVIGVVLATAVIGLLPSRWGRWLVWLVAILGLVAWWPGREAAARPLWSEPSIFTTDRETMTYRYLGFLQNRDTALVDVMREAGLRDVMIVSVHDVTYTLMRKMQKALPRVHFYGAPSSDGSRKPGAIVSLDLLRPLPLYHMMDDGSRYRLVGDTMGDGIYLPEKQVYELGWAQRLPAFSGWTKHSSLEFRADRHPVKNSPEIWRQMQGLTGGLEFPAGGRPVRFDVSVVKMTAGSDSLDIFVNGHAIDLVELPKGTARVDFSLWLPTVVGVNRLEMRRPVGAVGELKFTRLIFNDVPVNSGSRP